MDINKLQQLALAKRELLDKKARAGDLRAFTKATFPEYEINWHHEIFFNYLNAFIQKKIRRLMVFVPPRHGKSELTSRRLPALWHGLYPNDELMAVSYNNNLASDMTKDVQRIMDTDAYKRIFPMVKIPPNGSKTGYSRNANEHEIMPFQHPDKLYTWYTGSYKSAGVGGSFTGKGANACFIDDPVKNRQDADSASYREMMFKFYASTIRTRLEGEGSILITQTRWHESDLSGKLLQLAKSDPESDQWVVLSLPAIKEEEGHPDDHRMIGEPLWPSKFSLKNMLATKASVGTREWAALYQQTPRIDGGNIIKQEHMRFYKVLPDKFDEVIQSWDFASKDKSNSDYVVGTVWGRIGMNRYLLAMVRGRFSFPVSVQKVIDVSNEFPKAYKKLFEAKANGPAVEQTLRNSMQGIVMIEPRGDKVARLNAVAPMFESGHVWVPDESIAPWINVWIDEHLSFPFGTNDDIVDTTSQALDYLRHTGPIRAPISGHGLNE